MHTHTDIALYVYRFMYRYTVLLYTTCTDGMYFCVHDCKLLYNFTLPTHTCGAHIMLGSVVLLYIYTVVSAHLYCKLVLTNERPSEITFMNRVNQSQLFFGWNSYIFMT